MFSQGNGLKSVTPQTSENFTTFSTGRKEIYHLELALGATSRRKCLIFKIRSYSAISDLKNKRARFSGSYHPDERLDYIVILKHLRGVGVVRSKWAGLGGH